MIASRLDIAAARGCDGVEPDNVDGYDNDSGFELTRADQIDFNRFLATEAHQRGLSVGLKNALDLVEELEPAEHGKQGSSIEEERLRIYEWIREESPKDAIFITSYLPAFWTYAQRAQLASFRHPPLGSDLIEWHERLEALNGFTAFGERGSIQELSQRQRRLRIEQLVKIRDLYGATHYLTDFERRDLREHLLSENDEYYVYDLRPLQVEPED